MAGKHSKRGAHAWKIPAQRRPGIELVDAQTHITHRVASDELLAGRIDGNYQALCGARLLSASLTGRSRCWECQVTAPAPDRSPVDRPPSEAPGSRSAPPRETDTRPSSIEHVIAQLNALHDLIGERPG
jgi:hypothetical protein